MNAITINNECNHRTDPKQPRRHATHRMKPRFIFFVVFLISIFLVLASCISPEKDWQLAQRDDSNNAYLEFLAKHPDSQFAEQARKRLDELKVIRAWERAEFKDTLVAYQAFVDKYGDSEYAASARERARKIQRDEHWEEIDGDSGKAALTAFLETYPDAPQAPEARSRLATIAATEEAARPKERPGNFRLQLAAFKTVVAAEYELRRLVALAPEILMGPVRIEIPTPGSDSKMYLLKSVPMTNAEARDACDALNDLGQVCMIISR